MKKIISLILAVAMMLSCAFALASCGGNESNLKFGKEFTPLGSQMDVLLKLNAKSIDVGVMDSVMAGYYMSKEGNNFFSGDGIVKRGVEKTIEAVGKLARVGMCETDKEIIHIMLD